MEPFFGGGFGWRALWTPPAPGANEDPASLGCLLFNGLMGQHPSTPYSQLNHACELPRMLAYVHLVNNSIRPSYVATLTSPTPVYYL